MTPPRLDKVIHPANHLRLCALLAAASEVEFATLRDALECTDPSLSKYLRALQEAGYVTVSKPARAGRRRTWAALTPAGRSAFAAHVAQLQRLAALAGPPAAEADAGRREVAGGR